MNLFMLGRFRLVTAQTEELYLKRDSPSVSCCAALHNVDVWRGHHWSAGLILSSENTSDVSTLATQHSYMHGTTLFGNPARFLEDCIK